MANGHGGARPNSGRKPQTFKAMFDAAAKKVCTADKMEQILNATMEAALNGDVAAQKLFYDRLLGKVTDKVEVTGENGAPLVKIVFDQRDLTG